MRQQPSITCRRQQQVEFVAASCEMVDVLQQIIQISVDVAISAARTVEIAAQ